MHWAKHARYSHNWCNAGLIYARKERLPKLERAQIEVWIHETTNRKHDARN